MLPSWPLETICAWSPHHLPGSFLFLSSVSSTATVVPIPNLSTGDPSQSMDLILSGSCCGLLHLFSFAQVPPPHSWFFPPSIGVASPPRHVSQASQKQQPTHRTVYLFPTHSCSSSVSPHLRARHHHPAQIQAPNSLSPSFLPTSINRSTSKIHQEVVIIFPSKSSPTTSPCRPLSSFPWRTAVASSWPPCFALLQSVLYAVFLTHVSCVTHLLRFLQRPPWDLEQTPNSFPCPQGAASSEPCGSPPPPLLSPQPFKLQIGSLLIYSSQPHSLHLNPFSQLSEWSPPPPPPSIKSEVKGSGSAPHSHTPGHLSASTTLITTCEFAFSLCTRT